MHPSPQFQLERTSNQFLSGPYSFVTASQQAGRLEGYTKVFKEGRLVFEGLYHQSLREGFGVEYEQDRQVYYEGEYRADLFDGMGKTKIYKGEFREGYYDGYGVYATGDIYYEGNFQGGKRCGMGVLVRGQNIKRFQPVEDILKFIRSVVTDSTDQMKAQSIEEIYIGDFAQDKPHGFGRQWLQSRCWYAGQFAHGSYHGAGTQKNSEGKIICSYFQFSKITER